MSMQACRPCTPMAGGDFEEYAATLKALSDPARLAILATLARAGDEVCVCDFTAGLDVGQSTVSHHLKILKDAQLVTSVRRGTWGYYSLASGARARIETALDAVFPTKVLA